MPKTHTPSPLLKQRNHIIRTVRAFFDAQGFTEVDTPVLTYAPAPETHIEALATRVRPETSLRFLQTSPELSMKRLLAQGWDKIYQIAPVFRDNDWSPVHKPEFRLLEWYRAHAPWTQLLEDCENLLSSCLKALSLPFEHTYQNNTLLLQPPFPRIRMEEAFLRYAGFSILDNLERDALLAQLRAHNIHHMPDEPWDDLFFRVFLSRVEPHLLSHPQPVFLTHFPTPLAALAQRNPHDLRESERFEWYAGGLEWANGFGELTHTEEQTSRFTEAQKERAKHNMHAYPMPVHFLEALKHMPPSSGIALGIERLLMVLLNAAHIDDVCFVPWEQA